MNYHLAYIPDSFTETASEPFDRAYMNKLYTLGYDRARLGYDWNTTPPGYDTGVE